MNRLLLIVILRVTLRMIKVVMTGTGDGTGLI
jgi:hypothetical protein